MAGPGMAFKNGLAENLIGLDVPNPRRGGIAVSDRVLIVDKDDPLLHGGENGF